MATLRWTRLASRLHALPVRLLALAACLILTACDARVNVEATAVVPARYSSVLITVKEIWFNDSATAVPADATWQKFKLKKTVTLDLVDLTDGALASLASDLKVPAGTYQQVRVILASRDDDLEDSADRVDATWNNQVTWLDENDDEQTLPLEVLNADQGIGIGLDVKVKEGLADAATVQLLFDAARDLTEFRYSDQPGFLLNSTLKAYEPDKVGTIRGTLNLSQLSLPTGTSDSGIQIIAERLDDALHRRVSVGSASVSRTGAFALYPLPLDENEAITTYDLVIHGPEIQTIVIRGVPVDAAPPASATVVVPAILVLEPAASFEADIREDDPVEPRGAQIGFYQTLPGDNEPYLVELAAVDPLSGRFAQPVALTRASKISYATYGVDQTLRSGTPEEGASRYAVAALSPQYGNGALAATSLRPASQAADTAMFSVPAIGVPTSAVPGTISATVTIQTPGKYDRGVLMVTHEGAVVSVVALDDVLQQSPASAVVDVPQVPAGSNSATLDQGLYYLEAWTWDSHHPENTFTRFRGADAVDLRAAATATGSVAIE